MNFLILLDNAKKKLRHPDPFFQERTGLVLDILRSKGTIPYKRSSLNGELHRQVAAALVTAHESGASIDITTRRAQSLHELGYSTKILEYLDTMVKDQFLISKTNKAQGRLYLGNILTTYLDQPLAA
tara:strand:+ start:223 stop:603 length:381 start_codon:yes stop_codon:yes gene_type:complete